MGQTSNDCRSQITFSTNSPRQPRLLAGRYDSRLSYVLVHKFLRKLCIGPKRSRWLIQWMIWCLRQQEEFKCQILKHSTQKIASALNRIIHNTQSKRKVSLEEQKAQKEDRFFRGRQIAYLIDEYFRVTGANDFVENYADLFTNVLRNDDIEEFDSKCDGNLLSMTKIPSDEILEGLYKLIIREFEKLKTVLELYNMEIHQKKAGPDYHRLKTMVNRSIEQEIRNRNFEKNQGTNSVNKEVWEIVGNEKPTGSVWKETMAVSVKILVNVQKWHSRILFRVLSCSRVSENHREPEVPEVRARVVECRDGLARITSKELAINSFCDKWHPPECSFYKTKSGCRFEEKCSYAHRQVDEQPCKRSEKNDDKSAVALLKKYDLHDITWQLVVNRDKSHDRTGQPL